MKAMDILKRCRSAEEDKTRLSQLIEQRRELLDGLTGPRMDANGGGRGSPDPDKTGRLMADIDELERKKAEREEEQEVEKVATTSMMDWLSLTEGKILHLYYIGGMNTSEIGRKEKYTVGYVRKEKRKAEGKLEMLSEEQVATLVPRWYLERMGER